MRHDAPVYVAPDWRRIAAQSLTGKPCWQRFLCIAYLTMVFFAIPQLAGGWISAATTVAGRGGELELMTVVAKNFAHHTNKLQGAGITYAIVDAVGVLARC
jgi:hypothetical protein